MAVEMQVPAETDPIGAVPPGPKGAPIVGSLLDLRRDVLGTMHRAMLEFGDVVRFSGGAGKYRVEAFGLFGPDGAHHALAGATDNYGKTGEAFQEIRDLLGNGLLTSDGDEWKRQKRMVQPIFTHRRVAGYVPMMVEEAEGVVSRWSDAAARDETVDLHGDMTRATLRVVGRALFGQDVDHAVEVLEDPVPYLSRRAIRRSMAPVKIPATWPTPGNKRAARDQAAIYELVNDLIARRKGVASHEEDLLMLLLAAQDPENGQGLTEVEVHEQALIFLLAGHETTATSLTFTLHLLGHHPDVQKRLHDEVDEVLGGRAPQLDDVRGLEFTTMAIKEAMRLYPAAYSIARVPVRDDYFAGYRIPAGTAVLASPYVTHRHPQHWDAPERFNPDRFTPEREKARHRYAYIPFGGGPRACIGQHFSMLEAVIIVAQLMQRFQIATSPEPVKVSTGITLRPAKAMPARLTPR